MSETVVDWGTAEDSAEFTGENTMPRQTTTRTRRASTGRRVSDKRLENLKVKLSTEMFQAGTMISMGLPVTGYYISQESDTTCTALVDLASKRTEWVAALENIAAIGPGIALGRFALGLGAAAAADRYYRSEGASGLDPSKRIAMLLGVTSAYLAVHPPEGYEDGRPRSGFQPPPNVEYNPVS